MCFSDTVFKFIKDVLTAGKTISGESDYTMKIFSHYRCDSNQLLYTVIMTSSAVIASVLEFIGHRGGGLRSVKATAEVEKSRLFVLHTVLEVRM